MITKIVRSISTPIRLIEKVEEANDTFTFKFNVPDNINWEPGAYGHFISSNLENGQKVKKDIVRELSIMSHPKENYIGFTTRIRKNPSAFKHTMLHILEGEEIRIFKMGNHFKLQNPDKPIVMISMGVGIATLRPLIMEFISSNTFTSSIVNINIDRQGDLVYRKELEQFPKEKLKNILVTNREALYENIEQTIKRSSNIYYVVGSKEFNKDIGDFLLNKQVSKKAIVFDKH